MSLTVTAPRQGIAASPHVGFSDVRNIDIYSIPGIAVLNNLVSKVSSTTVTATVNWIVRDPVTVANFYAVDSNGVVYNSTDSGASWALLSDRAGQGQGLAIWENYLFVAGNTAIDVYGPLSGGAAWTTGWSGLTLTSDTVWHPMFTSKNDGKLYIGGGNIVSSVEENAGQTFAPGTGASYTATASALDLPSGYRIKCIEELGNNLMLGTWKGTNIYDVRVADIFPWDRSSVSFGQPISLEDFGVHAMKNGGNFLYVLAGLDGVIRRCNGVTAYPIGKIPTDISGGKYIEFYPGSIAIYKNRLFFGTGNPGSTVLANQGVYSLQETGKGNILTLEHLNSQLTDGSAAATKITALCPVTRDTMLSGFRSNTTYGIDLNSATSYAYTTNYSGYFDSPLYQVGDPTKFASYDSVNLQLVKPLATGEGVTIQWRKNLTDSFSTAITIDFASYGAIQSKEVKADIKDCEFIQFRIGLLGTSTTTPQFKSVTFK